jgi:hypothetical protein
MSKYYAEFNHASGNYDILDPEGDKIAEVMEEDIEILLSHLNRE